jgi:pimeloyl-ACP methyl ester carboxylesterase
VRLTTFHQLPVVAFALAILTGAHLDAAEPMAFSVQVTGKGAPVIFIPGFTCPGSVLKQADFSFFENARHFVFFDDPGKWIDVLKTALK